MKPQKYTVHAEYGYDCYLLADQKDLNATRIYLQYGQEVVLASDTEALEKRVHELESALCETCKDPRCEDSVVEHLKQKVARMESERQRIINIFKTGRDATGYSDEYFRGMHNGIEWARSCVENNEPQYKDSVDKSEPIYVPTIAEMTEVGSEQDSGN